MAWLRCPTCHQPFDSEQSRAMPFCSERCRLIDLGRWLNEEIGLPTGGEEEAGDADGEPPYDHDRESPRRGPQGDE